MFTRGATKPGWQRWRICLFTERKYSIGASVRSLFMRQSLCEEISVKFSLKNIAYILQVQTVPERSYYIWLISRRFESPAWNWMLTVFAAQTPVLLTEMEFDTFEMYFICTGVIDVEMNKKIQAEYYGMVNYTCWYCKRLFKNAEKLIHIWRLPVFRSVAHFNQTSSHLVTVLLHF